MKKIIEAKDLPENEKVYLKKDFIGWRVVEPMKTSDGKINWLSVFFGGKRGLLFLIIALVIFGLVYLGINELIANYKMVAENPCEFCEDCHAQVSSILSSVKSDIPKINFSNIKVGDKNEVSSYLPLLVR